MDVATTVVIKQHLIDPEICIRCNTCESICPVKAITHDSRNYVVDAAKCNLCMDCISPCPTGSIDNWRTMPRVKAYTLEEQFGWDALPAELSAEQLAAEGVTADADPAIEPVPPVLPAAESGDTAFSAAAYGASVPPWSAAHPYTNLYGPKKPIAATVVGNVRVTQVGREYDTHHIMLDFGTVPFPVLEGQSIGILPPGTDAQGRPHHARQYSVASPRNGERPGYNNLSLAIKRVLEDHQGNPARGVASNYMCDLKVGDTVQVIGPFGSSFLMPNHPQVERRDDLYRHWQRADARDDRVATPPARHGQVRGRQADALLRRPHEGGTALLRPAAEPAEGLHRHQLRVLAYARPAQALRAGRDARARSRPRLAVEGRRTPASTSAG